MIMMMMMISILLFCKLLKKGYFGLIEILDNNKKIHFYLFHQLAFGLKLVCESIAE